MQGQSSGQLARVWLLTFCGKGCGELFLSKEALVHCGVRDINFENAYVDCLDTAIMK